MKITSKIRQEVELQVKREVEPVFADFHRRMKPLKDIVLNRAPLPDGRMPTSEEVNAIEDYAERCYRDIFGMQSRREKEVIEALRKMPDPPDDQDLPIPPPTFFKKEGERYLNLGKKGPEQAALYALLPVIMLGSGILQGADFLLKGTEAAGKALGDAVEHSWNRFKFW